MTKKISKYTVRIRIQPIDTLKIMTKKEADLRLKKLYSTLKTLTGKNPYHLVHVETEEFN